MALIVRYAINVFKKHNQIRKAVMTQKSRRKFLKTTAIGSATVALGRPVLKVRYPAFGLPIGIRFLL
jgi:hypothetical protein